MTLLPTVRTAIPEVGIGRITPEIVSEIFSGLDLTEGTRIRNLSTTMGHSTGLIREQCPVW